LKKLNLVNPKGISVLFLVIAMMLMITIGYVFSYLIPTKQKSVIFPIQSTQAFYIAQSGVEYAVRYAVAHNWRTTTDLLGLNGAGVYQKNLGAGRFTITYINTAPDLDTLRSVGEVPIGTEKRRIVVTNFTSFMQQHLVLYINPPTYPAPCLTDTGVGYYYEVTFYIRNIDTSGSITLNSFRANWDPPPTVPDPTINRIRFNAVGGASSTRFTGSYSNGAAQTNFSSNQTMNNSTTYRVRIRWTSITVPHNFSNLIVYFYDTNGNEYTFGLDPEGDGLPIC
jgi:hypothetical protein